MQLSDLSTALELCKVLKDTVHYLERLQAVRLERGSMPAASTTDEDYKLKFLIARIKGVVLS